MKTIEPKSKDKFIEASIDNFIEWLDRAGYESYDPYDLWGTKFGLWARKIYYKKGKIGIPLIAPIILADLLFPSVRKFFVKKKRYATADAQILLAYLNLHALRPDDGFLRKAIALEKELLSYSIPGYKGLCWGYPFDWQNNKAMWPKNTPYITCTPYCYEAYLALYQATGEIVYLQRAESIAEFVYHDLNETTYQNNSAAGSYSPIDNSMVVNASAYRAFLLVDAGKRFDKKRYFESGLRNVEFIIQCQGQNGEWLYGMDTPADHFIDHFHTCFVLKNLYKINKILQKESIRKTIQFGFEYYCRELFDIRNRPNSFAKEPRFQIGKLELYNYAEAIGLGSLLDEYNPKSITLANELASNLIRTFQRPEGFFVTRTYTFGLKHTFPFIRWPQAQLFYALTTLLKANAQTDNTSNDLL